MPSHPPHSAYKRPASHRFENRLIAATIVICVLLAAAIFYIGVRGARAAEPSPQLNQAQVFHSFAPIARAPDISATTTSGTTLVALGTAAPVAWVCNTGSVFAYVMFGGASITVTAATGFPVPAGGCVTMTATGAINVAAITGTSTATVQVTLGTGNP